MIVTSRIQFMDWLKKNYYKTWTGSGYPSTVYHYANAVEKIMRIEGIETYSEFTDHIEEALKKYGTYGPQRRIGEEGHNTVINALKRFCEFLINEYDYELKIIYFFN